jgi:type II secretory pathway pseudopilin PulG
MVCQLFRGVIFTRVLTAIYTGGIQLGCNSTEQHMRIALFRKIKAALDTWNRALDRVVFFPLLEKLGRLSIVVSIVSFAWTYQSEREERIKARRLQAWQVINAAEGRGGSGGRLEALQDLVKDKVWLLGVNLAGAMLDGVQLNGAVMHNANLKGTFLQNSKLVGANLFEADLSDAILRGAQLLGTTFIIADAPRAQFVSADLRGANFSGADLTEADFWGAQLTGTNFYGANLSGANFAEAKGLSCEQLAGAYKWENAYRPPELPCGRDFPEGKFKSHLDKELEKLFRFKP